jgi:glutamate racemase
MSNASIGIFDSGFGGLTVMRAIIDALPYENLIYFGDTARLPYGEKSADAVRKFSLENAEFLHSLGIKLLVVACNTACSVAIDLLQQTFSIPILGTIEPAVNHLKGKIQEGAIIVLGTRRTIHSGVYQQKLNDLFPHNETVTIPCPLFVPIVEEGFSQHKIAELAAWEYLHPVRNKKIDAVLLACTHYPLLHTALKTILGEETLLIDPGMACANNIRIELQENGLLNTSKNPPFYKFYVSDDPHKFRKIGEVFLHSPMANVELISLSDYTHLCG